MTARSGQAASARNGARLEDELIAFHGRRTDWWTQRNYPETRGQRVIGRGAPDFFAWHPSTGKAVLFDAKSTTAKRWPVSLLAPHQFAALKHFPGIAGLYLRTSEGDAWVPLGVVEPLWRVWWSTKVDGTLTRADGIAVVGMDWTACVSG